MRVRGLPVIVVGGGDTAIEHVLQLQQYASTTTLVAL
jgi:thioredoxin reductase